MALVTAKPIHSELYLMIGYVEENVTMRGQFAELLVDNHPFSAENGDALRHDNRFGRDGQHAAQILRGTRAGRGAHLAHRRVRRVRPTGNTEQAPGRGRGSAGARVHGWSAGCAGRTRKLEPQK